MNSDVEHHIQLNCPWARLPQTVKQSIGNSQREFEKLVVAFSIRNQLRYKGNLVRTIRKDERKYYEDLLEYSRNHLMLYPYHLSDVVVKGLRVTPFNYYIGMMSDIMGAEKSYDALPNFTAADCLRLLGIGRNQYIDLMNQCRSGRRLFRSKPIRELLPLKPVSTVEIHPGWIVQAGYVTEDDVRSCTVPEKAAIDRIIDAGPQPAGDMDFQVVHKLYNRGLIYLDVPIDDDDCITMPPLEGFVMNRVLGDYFETLLYKIFVSIDEQTSVAELASVLQIRLHLVKHAVSMYCRLGFARKKNDAAAAASQEQHPSWQHWHASSAANCNNNVAEVMRPEDFLKEGSLPSSSSSDPSPARAASGASDSESLVTQSLEDQLLIDLSQALDDPSLLPEAMTDSAEDASLSAAPRQATPKPEEEDAATPATTFLKRIAVLYDSTLTAFLMMGNLSPGLKSHAVTMFEVGKLSDESLDSLLAELKKVERQAEGEAQRYFDHAVTLRDTVVFLRNNPRLAPDLVERPDGVGHGFGLDLIRCESLYSLDRSTCARILRRNYALLVSLSPLSNEITPVSSIDPYHVGPAIPEVNSLWFKLFLYHVTGSGPPSLLLCKGTRLRTFPKIFAPYAQLLITSWGHDTGVLPTSNALLAVNDALTHSAVLLQAHCFPTLDGSLATVPFPPVADSKRSLANHVAFRSLVADFGLDSFCGYVTFLRTKPLSRKVDGAGVSCGAGAGDAGSRDPLNGVISDTSAEILARELQVLGIDSKPEVGQTGSALRPESASTPAEEGSVEDWALLDCHFGVPLFDAALNSEICARIVSEKLFHKETLERMNEWSRKLSLRLLRFVVSMQDPLSRHEMTQRVLTNPNWPSTSTDRFQAVVDLPTQNLIFNNGRLSVWDGHQ